MYREGICSSSEKLEEIFNALIWIFKSVLAFPQCVNLVMGYFGAVLTAHYYLWSVWMLNLKSFIVCFYKSQVQGNS